MELLKTTLCVIGIFLFIALGVYLLVKSGDTKKQRTKQIKEVQETIVQTNDQLDELLDNLEQMNQPVKDMSDFFKQLNEKLFSND